MPGSTALQAYPYPVTTDLAVPASLQTLAQAVEKQVVAVFADTATRDSRWTTATGLANGAMCFITGTGELQLRSGGAWVVIGGRANPYASAAGLLSVPVTAGQGSSGTLSLTFPAGRFTQGPDVFLGMNSSAGGAIGTTFLAWSVTTSGCSAQAYPATTWGATQTFQAYWQALQMTSAATAG